MIRLVWCCCLSMLAASEVRIHLAEAVEVSADRVHLGEIALIEADEGLRRALAACEVQRLPGLAPYAVDAPAVRAAIADLIDPRQVHITGSCTVQRGIRLIDEAELGRLAEAALREALPSGEVSVAVLRSSGAIRVPADAELTIETRALVSRLHGEVPYRVLVLAGGQELARALVVLEVAVQTSAVVAVNPIERGATVEADDVRIESRTLVGGGQAPVADPALAVGRVATRRIAAGEAVQASQLREPWLIRAGARVELLFRGAGFELRAGGEALGNAARGEQVRIRRATGEVVTALVVGEGLALVNY